MYFCTVYDHEGKADLSKGCSNPKRKLGEIPHFSQEINFKSGKKMPLFYRSKLHSFFRIVVALIILEKCMATHNFLLDSNRHC